MTRTVTARWATAQDAAFLETAGVTRLPAGVLQRKIEGREVVIASSDERPVGYAYVDHLWSYVPFIATIWVDERERNRGVGRSIVTFIEDDTRAKGGEVVYSSSQCDEAEPQAWHRRVGFEECGVLAGHNEGVGELFFRKKLG